MNRMTKVFTGAAVALAVAAGCTDTATGPNVGGGPQMSHGVTYSPGADIRAPGDHFINGARWTAVYPFGVGTGVIDPFLTLQSNGSQHAFNTDASPLPLDAKRPQFTDALPLNNVPVILEDGGTWRELILDANEPSSGTGPQFSIDVFDLYVCQDSNAKTYSQISHFAGNPLCTRVYHIDGQGSLLATSDNTSGSGNTLDYRILIPAAVFGDAANNACQYNPLAPDCGYYIVLYTHMGGVGGDYVTEATFEEFSTIRRGFITVTKTANTTFTRTTTRTWEWEIEKEITNPGSSALIQPNQTLDIDYKVTLDATYQDVEVDSNWKVTGNITVSNPSGQVVSIASVADVISHASDPDINVAVNCPVSFPHNLSAGGTLVCTYEQSLPNGDERTNQAHVTLADQAAVTSASVPVIFGAPTTAVFNEIDECVDVDDIANLNGVVWQQAALGTHCAAQGLPKTFEYTRTVTGAELECNENTIDNTASFETNDTGATGSAGASIEIVKACIEGCTLTQGYWKTHSKTGPAPYNPGWLTASTPQEENTPFFNSGKTWYQIFWTPPSGGNRYLQLAHQYMAAKLNVLNGADAPANVLTALSEAENLFNGAANGVTSFSGANANKANQLASLLDSYNKGVIGPGHCTE